MADTPVNKKRFTARTCWQYMEKGTCSCVADTPDRLHPKLSLAKTTTTDVSSGAKAPVLVATMLMCIPEWKGSCEYKGFVEGDPNNFAVLATSYEDIGKVKALGATYSLSMKKWIVDPGRDLGPFSKWTPSIRGRAPGEFIMFRSTMDMTSAVRGLQRCGLRPLHFDIRGSDSEAENLRKELEEKESMMQQCSRVGAAGNQKSLNEIFDSSADGANEKKRVGYNEHSEHANRTKRPRFAVPESPQTPEKQKQYGLSRGTNYHTPTKTPAASPQKECERQNELSRLVAAARNALVVCNSSDGISKEQKKFNDTIYNVVEALADKVQDSEGEQPNRNNQSTTKMMSPRKNTVTPTQKMGCDGKVPGVPSTWYDST